MKYPFLTILLLFFLLNTAKAQEESTPFEKGQIDLNAGLGLLSLLRADGSESKMPPITLAADYAISDMMSIGGFVTFAKNKIDYRNTWGEDVRASISHTIIGCRSLFHFYSESKFDPYLNGMLAYDAVSSKVSEGSPYTAKSQLRFGIYVGSRYYFADDAAIYGELGFGASLMNIGLSFKFHNKKHTDNEQE